MSSALETGAAGSSSSKDARTESKQLLQRLSNASNHSDRAVAYYGATEPKGSADDRKWTVPLDLLDTGPEGLSEAEVAVRLERFGPNELPEKVDNTCVKFLLEFVQPMPLMIWAAIFIELLEFYYQQTRTALMDALILFVLQMLNVVIGFIEELKASEEIAALKASLKPEAMVVRGGKVSKVNASTVVPGDRVVLAAGAAVPADSAVADGQPQIQVDQAALTGESLPVTMKTGDMVKMGSTVTRGECEAIVHYTGANTSFGKTAAMINSVDAQPHFEIVLQQLLYFLVGMGVVVCASIFFFLQQLGTEPLAVLSFVVVLLVASIPVALRVVCTCTLAVGCKELAAEEAIVARLSAVEELAGMDILCSDKTGTLTLNQMELQDDLPLFDSPSAGREDVLRIAALAAKWWEPAKDALDKLVLEAVDGEALTKAGYQQIDYVPFDPATKRTEATIKYPDGREVKVMKGAPDVVMRLCVGNVDKVAPDVEDLVLQLASRGIRSLGVASANPKEEYRFLGMLTFLDPPRLDTKITVEKANELGVQVKMITGDHKAIAKETCRLLGMGTDIKGTEELPELSIEELTGADAEGKVARLGIDYGPSFAASDGFAQVFPEHKYIIVEALRQRGHLVGMTGDGINDAPALKRADVGIAVQGATNAAQAAADIVLTRPGLSTIVTAIVTSRKIFQRMKNFVIYRVACTAQLLFFFFISCVFFDPSAYNPEWDPYFKLPVMALVSITILNDGTIISVAYDNVVASTKPEQWDLTTLYAVAASIGTPALVSSLLLLHVLLKSNDQDSMWTECGLPGLSFGQIQMLMYLKISLSDYASLFNCRCRGWMWERAPSEVVVVAATFAMFAATGLSLFLPPGEGMETVSPLLALVVWLYTAVWALVQDVSKMAGYALLHRFKFLSQDDVGFDDSALDNFTVKAAHLAKQTLHKKKPGLEAQMNRPPENDPSDEKEVSAV